MRLDLGPSLSELKTQTEAHIDREAEVARLRFLTAGAGQALEYQATEAEARKFLVTEDIDLDDFPFLRAEAQAIGDVTGNVPALVYVALEVLHQADLWRAAGSEIKRLRRSAKLAVNAATSAAQVREAATISWPQPDSA
jgi:hypothetical protein